MLIYLEKTYLLESSNSRFKETGLELWYPTSRARSPREGGEDVRPGAPLIYVTLLQFLPLHPALGFPSYYCDKCVIIYNLQLQQFL